MRLVSIAIVFTISAAAQSTSNVFTVIPKSNLSSTGELRFRDKQTTPHYVGFRAPTSISSNLIWTLPGSDVAGMLCSDGAGLLSFSCTTGDFTQLFITRSGVHRVELFGGGPGAGGIVQTLNTAGDTVLNKIDETGVDAKTLKIGGTTTIDATQWGTFNHLSVLRSAATRIDLLGGGASSGGIIQTYNAAGDTILNKLDQSGADLLTLSVSGALAIDASLWGTFNHLTVLRSGVTRIDLLGGGLTAGGIIQTYNAAGTTVLNKLDQSGGDLLSLLVGGTTVIDSSRNGTVNNLTINGTCTGCPGATGSGDFTQLFITRSGAHRVELFGGGPGAGGIIHTLDIAGTTVLNTIDETGAYLKGLQVGTIGSNSTSATPTLVNFDSTSGNTTLGKNFKLKLYTETGQPAYDVGFGISSALMELVTTTAGSFAFYQNHATAPVQIALIGSAGIDASGGYKVGTTSIVDSSRNAAFASLSIAGSSAIDSSRNGSLYSLSINGTQVLDSSRNLTVTSCSGCLSALSASITLGADNTYDIGTATTSLRNLYTRRIDVFKNGTDAWPGVQILAGGTGATGSVLVVNAAGTSSSAMNNNGISTNIGYAANGSSGVSATFDPNSCSSVTFTFGILTAKTGC